jgi:hypothetical protein
MGGPCEEGARYALKNVPSVGARHASPFCHTDQYRRRATHASPPTKNIHRRARDGVGMRRSLPPQRAQGHGVILAIQYRSTASSAAKSTATVTDGGRHVNCSRNSRLGPISLSREKTSSNDPEEFAAQRDASTDTTAVHFRSSLDGCISENWTSANAKVGLHACWPAASVTLIRGIAAARNAGMQDRCMGGLLAVDLCQSPRWRG